MPSLARARMQLLIAAALFSTGGAAIKGCQLTGWQVGGLRSAIAVVAFLILVPAARRWPGWRELVVATAYATCLVLFVLANKLTTAADAIFLQSAAPLYILILSPWLLRERVTRRDFAFMASIGIGVALFFVDPLRDANELAPRATAPDPWLGRVVGLGSGVAWAFTVIGLRWLGQREEDGRGGAGAVVLGNALAALASAPFALPLGLVRVEDVLWILYLGVFQIALAYRFVTAALRVVPALEASVLLLVEPVFNPIWAWLVHAERPTAWALVGGAVIVGTTLMKTWIDTRGVARPEAAA